MRQPSYLIVRVCGEKLTIQLVSECCHSCRMVRNGMVCGRHTQAACCTKKKTQEHYHILHRGHFKSLLNASVESYGRESSANSADKMCPYVDSLIVNVPDTCNRLLVRIRCWPVAARDEPVILLPCKYLTPGQGNTLLRILAATHDEGCSLL